MKTKINSRNQNKKRRINTAKLDKIAEAALKELGKNGVELNIVFVSNQKIRALNRQWFGRDNSTDVIAWPSGDTVQRTTDNVQRIFLGDIAISSDKAKQNAVEYGNTFYEELALYVIHGILHLLGYDDMSAKDRKKMKRMENGISEKIRRFL